MPKTKPEGMDDETWAAVCIIMEDHQISSYRELTESHKAMIQRMDEMETKLSERPSPQTATEPPAEPVTPAPSGTGTQGGGDGRTGEVTPPPVVNKEEGEEEGQKTGSGRGGKLRWYEREGYAK